MRPCPIVFLAEPRAWLPRPGDERGSSSADSSSAPTRFASELEAAARRLLSRWALDRHARAPELLAALTGSRALLT